MGLAHYFHSRGEQKWLYIINVHVYTCTCMYIHVVVAALHGGCNYYVGSIVISVLRNVCNIQDTLIRTWQLPTLCTCIYMYIFLYM